MKIYTVGGAVRDALLGRPVKDRDYVVVGATPKEMLARGFRPVGRDFPVFLHPQTQAEYALARTERKSGHGYHGFTFHAAPEVTLAEDLARRDLTINAMAQGDDGELVDPFDGQRDLRDKILRHVGPAFAEDPVRILRVARFAARFPDFSIAPETLALMQEMVASGEVDHLVPERVWAELSNSLSERHCGRFFEVLDACGALPALLPELARLKGVPQRVDYHPEGDAWVHTLMVLDAAAVLSDELAIRFAALLHDLGKGLTPAEVLPRHIGHEARGKAPALQLCERLRVPNDCRELALLAIRHHGQIHQLERADGMRPETIARLLREMDAFRRPERFERLLQVCTADYAGRLGERPPYTTAQRWRELLAAASAVDAGAVAAGCAQAQDIPVAVEAARAAAVGAALKNPAQIAPGEP
jgi:tRNA nucleotidyltransferase (CCA-adding enzyme)